MRSLADIIYSEQTKNQSGDRGLNTHETKHAQKRMPNVHGGKAYKKGKRAVAPDAASARPADELGDGQLYARVLRMLGDRRVTCFCNDGVERICKIRGALCKGPKKQRITVNDIVIISCRTFDSGDAGSSDDDKDGGSSTGAGVADIIAWVAPQHHRQVKKRPDTHRHLFASATTAAGGDGLDDLFEDEGAATAATADADSDVDIDDI